MKFIAGFDEKDDSIDAAEEAAKGIAEKLKKGDGGGKWGDPRMFVFPDEVDTDPKQEE